jgi:hypothetical protein
VVAREPLIERKFRVRRRDAPAAGPLWKWAQVVRGAHGTAGGWISAIFPMFP